MSVCESSVAEEQTHSSLCSGTHAVAVSLLLPATLHCGFHTFEDGGVFEELEQG